MDSRKLPGDEQLEEPAGGPQGEGRAVAGAGVDSAKAVRPGRVAEDPGSPGSASGPAGN